LAKSFASVSRRQVCTETALSYLIMHRTALFEVAISGLISDALVEGFELAGSARQFEWHS
jgi:hypothetical protein